MTDIYQKLLNEKRWWNQRVKERNEQAGSYSDKDYDKYERALRERIVLKTLKDPLADMFYNNDAESSLKVCDVGCGVGTWPLFFARMSISAVGIDFSPEMILLAHARTRKKIPFIVMSASQMGFPNASFDILASITVLQHIFDEQEFNRIVVEISRVVKPEGYALILESSPFKKSKKEESGLVRIRTRGEYIDLFMRNGFVLVNETRVCRFFGLKALVFVGIFNRILRMLGARWKMDQAKKLLLRIVFPLDVLFSLCPILREFCLVGVLLFKKHAPSVEKQSY